MSNDVWDKTIGYDIYESLIYYKPVIFLCNIMHRRLIEYIMGLRLRQGNLRLVFRLIGLMRSLPSIRLKQYENEPEISLSRPQTHHPLFFSPIIFKTENAFNIKISIQAI